MTVEQASSKMLTRAFVDALAGPYQDIPIPRCAKNLDWEGELCFVIGRDCKDLEDGHNPSDYILGFMAGNDLDLFLASYEAIGDPETLDLETLVNGEVRQRGNTSDFLFSLRDIMINLTRGKTLRKGTIVMTGTPSGVAAFMKPPAWLKDNDEVEVRISGLGTLRNRHIFSA
ncbi:hypothetical protein LTS10_010739 [Elasticomyces elasticus]|nr:hypothetical protein LTS10_010739 [Elasticomyces elasticus]